METVGQNSVEINTLDHGHVARATLDVTDPDSIRSAVAHADHFSVLEHVIATDGLVAKTLQSWAGG